MRVVMRKHWGRCLAALFVATFIASACGNGQSQTPPERAKHSTTTRDDLLTKSKKRIEELSRPQARENGVLATISVAVDADDDAGQQLVVDWSLDYSGPRFPLHILKPSMKGNGGQTRLLVLFHDAEGTVREVEIASAEKERRNNLDSAWQHAAETFAVAGKDKPATGRTCVPLRAIHDLARKAKPLTLDPNGYGLWVRLLHISP